MSALGSGGDAPSGPVSSPLSAEQALSRGTGTVGPDPGESRTAGPAAIAAFIRARLEDLGRTAGTYHADGATPDAARCRSLDYRGPCDCDEPNRRRRRAFTHGNLVDWAEQAIGVTDADDYALDVPAVLRHLAAEWSDHPDYDTEWGPLP